jgi:hypothetical protein
MISLSGSLLAISRLANIHSPFNYWKRWSMEASTLSIWKPAYASGMSGSPNMHC